jgi:hypothetical protein
MLAIRVAQRAPGIPDHSGRGWCEPRFLLAGLEGPPLPRVSREITAVLVGPDMNGLSRLATGEEVVLSERLAAPAAVSALLREGRARGDRRADRGRRHYGVDQIDGWLAQWHAEVLMLTPRALESPWVLSWSRIRSVRPPRASDAR